MSTLVPNVFPAKPAARRLAVIGESPGASECAWHICTRCHHGYDPKSSYSGSKCPDCVGVALHAPTPFCGPSGRLLNKLLAEAGIDRESCYVGNCCQVQPPGNNITLFKPDGPELTAGMAQLRADLAAFQPHMLLLLGNTPLRMLTGDRKRNVGDWRGSLMEVDLRGSPASATFRRAEQLENSGSGPNPADARQRLDLASEEASSAGLAGSNPVSPANLSVRVKCLPTYHPAALLRDYSLTAVCRFDFKRLAEELRTDGLVLPQRDVVIMHPDNGWTPEHIDLWVTDRIHEKLPLAVDIEGVIDYVECIGFAACAGQAFVVPFINVAGESVWSEEDECAIWCSVERLLADQQVPKILQNALYDAFVLAWSYGICVRGIHDDTMLKHHELYAELEKSLGFQASIYTRQPFYKFQRKRSKELDTTSTLDQFRTDEATTTAR